MGGDGWGSSIESSVETKLDFILECPCNIDETHDSLEGICIEKHVRIV